MVGSLERAYGVGKSTCVSPRVRGMRMVTCGFRVYIIESTHEWLYPYKRHRPWASRGKPLRSATHFRQSEKLTLEVGCTSLRLRSGRRFGHPNFSVRRQNRAYSLAMDRVPSEWEKSGGLLLVLSRLRPLTHPSEHSLPSKLACKHFGGAKRAVLGASLPTHGHGIRGRFHLR